MIELKEILLRIARGESKKAIKRSLGIHKSTIKKYINLSKSFGVEPVRDGVSAITEELIEKIKRKESGKTSCLSCS